jgi:hypothetical protein
MCQLPVSAGGLSGGSIFIDTNFGFSPRRYKGLYLSLIDAARYSKYCLVEIRDQIILQDNPINWKTDTEPLVLRAPGLKEILSVVQTVRSALENKNFKVTTYVQ